MIIAILGALVLAAACSRPLAVPTDGSISPADRTSSTLPAGGSKTEPQPEESSAKGQSGQSNLPFKDRENLPAGTMISVRLSNAIVASDPSASDTFEAVVSQPVVVGGNTLIPSGSTVAGHIESARVSTVNPDRGYVRLTLETVHVRGVDVTVQTASLFAKQSHSSSNSSPAVHIEKGRGLTFRLTQPVYIATSLAQSGR